MAKNKSMVKTNGETDGAEWSLEPITPEFLAGATVERLVKLENGMGIRGAYRGEGPVVELETVDPVTGEVKTRALKTWRLEVAPMQIARLLGSAQLDREFAETTIGARVRVGRIGLVQTRKGHQVADFVFARE